MISLQVKDFLSNKAYRLVRSRLANGTYLAAAEGRALRLVSSENALNHDRGTAMALWIPAGTTRFRQWTVQATVLALVLCPTIWAEQKPCLRWNVDTDSGQLAVRRVACDVEWQGTPLAEISYWDAQTKARVVPLTAATGWTIERRAADGGCQLQCRQSKLGLTLQISLTASGDVLTTSVPAAGIQETGKPRIKELRLLPRFGAAQEGESGYLVIAQQSGALCHFRDKPAGEHRLSVYQSICQCPMPLFGLVRGNNGIAGIVTSGQYDTRLCVTVNHGPRKELRHRSFHYAAAPTVKDLACLTT